MGFFRKKTKKDKNENYRKMQFRIMYSFGLIIIVVSAVLASVILERSGTVMRQKVASLVAAYAVCYVCAIRSSVFRHGY